MSDFGRRSSSFGSFDNSVKLTLRETSLANEGCEVKELNAPNYAKAEFSKVRWGLLSLK